MVVLVYRRFLAATDAWTATTIGLAIVLAFAFAEYGTIGNYNFVSPYSHEILHGLALSIVVVVLLSSWLTRPRRSVLLGAGFGFGLVFLTKPEVFVALGVCASAAFVLVLVRRERLGFALQSLALFGLAGWLPLLGFLLYFRRFEGWRASGRSVVSGWIPLLQSSASQNPFYRWCLGLDRPFEHVRAMLLHFAALVALLAVYAWVFRRRTPFPRLVPLFLVTPLLALAGRFDWTDCGRCLPLLTLALGVLLWVKRAELPPGQPWVFPFLWSVFSLALLAKLGFFCRIWHYGFALAMPAFVGAVYLLLWLVPLLLEKHGVQRRLLRGTVWLVLMLGLVFLFGQSELRYRRKTVPVGQGGNCILAFDSSASPAGSDLQSALRWMETNAPPDATLAVLPEGVMVNYLSRRTNPTGYFLWDPVNEAAFGRDAITSAFERHSPDYVMLIDRDQSELGVRPFGQREDFGLDLMRWIQSHYEPVCLIGQEPLRNGGFGVKILRKLP